MKVKRIVADVAVSGPAEAKRFYQDVLGLETVMAMGWIVTLIEPCQVRSSAAPLVRTFAREEIDANERRTSPVAQSGNVVAESRWK